MATARTTTTTATTTMVLAWRLSLCLFLLGCLPLLFGRCCRHRLLLLLWRVCRGARSALMRTRGCVVLVRSVWMLSSRQDSTEYQNDDQQKQQQHPPSKPPLMPRRRRRPSGPHQVGMRVCVYVCTVTAYLLQYGCEVIGRQTRERIRAPFQRLAALHNRPIWRRFSSSSWW
jgi:hypothetical protein